MIVSPLSNNLLVGPGGGQTTQLTATALDAAGREITGRAVTWASNSSAATVSAEGVVTAIAPGFTVVSATIDGEEGEAVVTVFPVPVATVTLSSDAIALEIGPAGAGTHQFSYTLRDSTGAVLAPRTLGWSSNAAGVATVSTSGHVTAVGAGEALIIAGREGRLDTAWVTVTLSDVLPGDADISITNAQWTQGMQAPDGSIPLIRNGRDAVLNVLLEATRSIATPSQLTLRIRESNGDVAYTASKSIIIQTGAAPLFASPTAQFLVPNAVLQPGRSWELERDPAGELIDASVANDHLPRDGPTPLNLAEVPLLRIRLIPVSLGAHGNVTGTVTPELLAEYTRIVRAIYPHGEIEVTIGPVFTTPQVFGTGTTGGGTAFWIPLLNELDFARVNDPPNASAHWLGVVRPPPGFNFTTYGGYGYIPSDGADFGPFTRTATLISYGWATRESYTRELVAHELGHTFGRYHAPCGAAGGPDPNYPIVGGRTGPGGHDVASWSASLTPNAVAISEATGDVMGYCTPLWISRYTYEGVLNFRGFTSAALRAPVPAPTRVLVVRGTIEGDRISLDPSREVVAPPTSDDPAAEVTVEGLDASGRVLVMQRVRLGRYDHAPGIRPFAAYLAIDPAQDAGIVEFRVRTATAQVRRPRGS